MLNHVGRNWKTTVGGAIALLAAGWKVYENPAILGEEATVATIVTAVALIFAKDADKTGTGAGAKDVATEPKPDAD